MPDRKSFLGLAALLLWKRIPVATLSPLPVEGLLAVGQFYPSESAPPLLLS